MQSINVMMLTRRQCKPCQEDALPTIFDRAVTHPTSDDIAAEVQVLSDRAGARPPKNYCIVICTHAHCASLCTNPGHLPSGAIDEVGTAANSSTADLLDLANAQPDQIGVLLEDGITTMITSLDADGKLEGTCMWVCSGKVSCRLVCCNSAAVEAQCSLIKDAGGLPEGQAIEGTGKCEIVKKNKVVELLVCQVPEATGGGKLTAGLWDPLGVHCDVYNIGFQPIVVCHDAD